MSENQKVTKVSEETAKTIESGYPGITIVEDKNFVPRSELTLTEIKKFPLVLVQLSSRFVNKSDQQRDNITYKVFPFVDIKNPAMVSYNGFKTNKFCDLLKVEDTSCRLTRNEFVSIMLSMGKTPELVDQVLNLPRYARFITGVNNDGVRHYRIQLFISGFITESVFLNTRTLNTISSLIQAKYIAPITFVEATSSDMGFEDEVKDLI